MNQNTVLKSNQDYEDRSMPCISALIGLFTPPQQSAVFTYTYDH